MKHVVRVLHDLQQYMPKAVTKMDGDMCGKVIFGTYVG
jgi:hypothetical protein